MFPRTKYPKIFSLAPPDYSMFYAVLKAAKSMGVKRMILITSAKSQYKITSQFIRERAKILGINIIKEYIADYYSQEDEDISSEYENIDPKIIDAHMERNMKSICKELLLQKTR